MKDAKTDTKSVLSSEAFCKLAYKSFLTKSASVPCQSQEKWLADCKSFDFNTTDWGKSYTLASLCTRESKLRVFQLKLRHGKLATNYFLFKIGIKSMINVVSVTKARKHFCSSFVNVLSLNPFEN